MRTLLENCLILHLDYSEDQPRDESGRFGEGSGSSGGRGAKPTGKTETRTLFRVASDDYVDQGKSFAEEQDTANEYLDNPGFGGSTVYSAEVSYDPGEVLDLTGYSVAEAAEELGLNNPGAIGVDEWLPRTQKALDEASSRGYHWAKVSESFPRGTTTWIYIGGGSTDEPELSEAS
jgi:hypothetical protein